MDVLCGLFDTVAAVGEVLGRTEEKDQELASLSNTVESISASVRTFAGDLSPTEREAVYNSNKIFPDLLQQLQRCAEVLYGPQTLGGNPQDRRNLIDREVKQLTEGKQTLAGVLARVKQGIATGAGILNESLEVMNSKFGVVGTLLRLPEDELAKIRDASRQLFRMVPLLNLAISAHTARGRKRPLEGHDSAERPSGLLRLEAGAVASPQARSAASARPSEDPTASPANARAAEVPVVRMQPVSDVSWGVERLPEITSEMLRPASAAAVSSNSLDSDEAPVRKVFGRQEVKDRLPQGVNVPVPEHVAAGEPLFRFVSRDLFSLEPLPVPLTPAFVMQGSLDMETLAFGVPDDPAAGATLAFGTADPQEEDPSSDASADLELATVAALTTNGIHVKLAGESTWRWSGKSAGRRLKANDIIGVLLESPPGSFKNNKVGQDLQEEQARCLLGLELLPSG